jgi:8-oxo-dGTP pyrophosphatase MutT (NUDIX family)
MEIFIEETSKMGTLRELLEEAGYDLGTDKPVLDRGRRLRRYHLS